VSGLTEESPPVLENEATINNNLDDLDDDSDSSSEEFEFRSSSLQKENNERKTPHNVNLHNTLSNRFLVSCHRDGEALLWDLSRQTNVAQVVSSHRGGPGLTVKRTSEPGKIIVHTRDPRGVVSIHSIDHGSSECSVVRETVTVVDDRDDKAVVTIPIKGNHGMLTTYKPCDVSQWGQREAHSGLWNGKWVSRLSRFLSRPLIIIYKYK
jgi:hypothetical protein